MNQHRYVPMLSCLAIALLAIALFAPAAAALPPRPNPEPTPAPLPSGAIQLTISSAPADLWTMVQWQDALGDWHDVSGWQGTLDDGVKTWWVDEAHYGKGPFRWAVSLGGEELAASESFALPTANGQIVRSFIALEP